MQLELSDRFATKNPHPVLTFKKRIIHQDRVFIVEWYLPVVPPKTPAADKSRAAYACSGGSVSFAMFNQLTLRLKARFSTLLDRVEDPVEILDYSYTRQVEQLYVLRRDVADLVTAKKRVAQQRDRRQEQFLKLDAGARRALELGREDLARRALERKQLVGQELVGLGQVVCDLEREQAQMIARGRDARARVERFRSRKELAKARYAAAKAQLAISEAVVGISSELQEAGLRAEQAMERAEEMNLRAEVIRELESMGTLEAIGTGEDDIDRQLRRLSSGGSVDAEISRLKRELNPGTSTGSPG